MAVLLAILLCSYTFGYGRDFNAFVERISEHQNTAKVENGQKDSVKVDNGLKDEEESGQRETGKVTSGVNIAKSITISEGSSITVNPWEVVLKESTISGFRCVETMILLCQTKGLSVTNGTKYSTTYPSYWATPGFSNGYYYTYNVKGLESGTWVLSIYVRCYTEKGIMPVEYITGDYFVNYTITVQEPPKVTSIVGIPNNIELDVDQNYTFSPTILEKGAKTSLAWTSSNPSVVSVSGRSIRANAVGQAVVKCTASNGVSAQCAVTVKPVAVESIVFNSTSIEIVEGQQYALNPTVYPWNATSQNLSWKSSNDNIAFVNSYGEVTGVSSGNCRITATATDGSGASADCIVCVYPPSFIESLILDKSSTSIMVDESATLKATLLPLDASNPTLSWKSNKPSIASVDKDGNVKGVSTGSAIITVSTTDGTNLSASCNVTVQSNLFEIEYVVNDKSYHRETYQYGHSVNPPESPEVTGYSFLGWSELPATMPAQNLQVKAHLRVNRYLLTYKYDDMIFFKKDSVEYDAPLQIESAPEKEGYSFSGWTIAPFSNDDEDTTELPIPERMPAHDLTLCGYYSLNSYLLTYIVDGEIYKTESVEFGSAIQPMEAPEKFGYTFVGWENMPDRMPANDVIVYGSFIEGEQVDISSMDNVIYINKIGAFVGQQITLSLRMKNTAAIRGFQFDLYLPDGVTAVKNSKGRIQATLNDERLPEDDEHTLIASEQADGGIRMLCGSQYDETFTGTDGEILNLTVQIAEDMANGGYPIILRNMKLTETNISNFYEVPYLESTLILSSCGDINSDGKVDVSDYIGVANHIMGNTPVGFAPMAADVDGNGTIDVKDYTGIANLVLFGSIYGR